MVCYHFKTTMARRRKRRKHKVMRIGELFADLKTETIQGILAIVFFVLGLFLLLAAAGYGGVVGGSVYQGLSFLLGVSYFLLPLVMLVLAGSFLHPTEEAVGFSKWIGAFFLFISGIGLTSILLPGRGGIIGGFIATPLLKLFDIYFAVLILFAIAIIALLVIFNTQLPLPTMNTLRKLFNREHEEEKEDYSIKDPSAEEKYEDDEEGDDDEEEDMGEHDNDDDGEEVVSSPLRGVLGFGKRKHATHKTFGALHEDEYVPPPLSLLEKDRGKPGTGDIKANANIIKRTLQNFGIVVEIDEISIGPTVTRYAVKPAEGVRISKIVSLTNNLELALAAYPVRIEAPIPGRSLVGIEVPNTSKSTVGLASLLGTEVFAESGKPLLVTLGKDITGHPHFADLAKMPHILIAGATGAGKSVVIHALITSLLYRNSPQMLRFIMIDPKRVELTIYNGIPHLLTPVITDAKKTILALKWAAKEMDRRYDILEAEAVRDVGSYHANIVAPALKKTKGVGGEQELPEAMPYIVIVIDELADIMHAYPRELESAIVRLAQMSRAVGIHLILSTQRPSVNIITGLIKANIPVRIALQVSSQIDSRTILDSGGAEKLLGAGDMLYLSGDMAKPRRIQSAFISEQEVKRVVKYLVDRAEEYGEEEISLTSENGNGSPLGEAMDKDMKDGAEEDELYEEARELVIQIGKASTSYLQRKLRVGYARAARLMDMLEERGVIGPQEGSKPRKVFEQYETEEEDDEEEEKS